MLVDGVDDARTWPRACGKPAGRRGSRFRQQCSPTGKLRSLRRHLNRVYLEAAQRALSTQNGKRRYRQRQAYVETIFGIAKERHGMRRAQWRGRWRVQIQVWLTAAAMNLKKLVKSPAVSKAAESAHATPTILVLLAAFGPALMSPHRLPVRLL